MTQETYSPEQLKEVLDQHRKWLRGEISGKRANLTGVNLRGVNLSGEYLSGANLTGADLFDADLSGANLRGADLSGADLSGAYLFDANLSGADLSKANLTGAYLLDAHLLDANLSGANLSGADLSKANLSGADLNAIRTDFFSVLAAVPADVPALLAKLREGAVDGSVYSGSCACLVGTIANARGCNYGALEGLEPDSERPAEKWFTGIAPGQTPANNPVAKLTVDWIQEWLTAHSAATLVTCATCGEPGDHADLTVCVAALKARPTSAPVAVTP